MLDHSALAAAQSLSIVNSLRPSTSTTTPVDDIANEATEPGPVLSTTGGVVDVNARNFRQPAASSLSS